MAEYQLSYTAAEIDEKLGKVEENATNINQLTEKIGEISNDVENQQKQINTLNEGGLNLKEDFISEQINEWLD